MRESSRAGESFEMREEERAAVPPWRALVKRASGALCRCRGEPLPHAVRVIVYCLPVAASGGLQPR